MKSEVRTLNAELKETLNAELQASCLQFSVQRSDF